MLPEPVERYGARVAAALPAPVRSALAGRRQVRLDGQPLDPQIQAVLALRERRGVPPLDALTPAEARARVRREARLLAGRGPAVDGVREVEVAGGAGDLRARHYRPEATGHPAPLLLYFHGGGFVTCDLDTHDVVCRMLCRHAGVHVLSVAYRLAPEHPFPAPLDDARTVLSAAAEHAEALGADPERVAVGGDSAGGNLAAAATRLAIRAGGRGPAAQLLIYPATHARGSYPSRSLFADGFYLTAADIDWYHEQYTGPGNEYPGDARLSPLLADDLAGMPPALVVTAGFDPLRDEGERYAEALRAAGTATVTRRFPSLVHGFLHMTGACAAAHDAVVEIGGMLRCALDQGPVARPGERSAR